MKKYNWIIVFVSVVLIFSSCKEKANELYRLTNVDNDVIGVYYETKLIHDVALEMGQMYTIADIDDEPFWNAKAVIFSLRDTFYIEESKIGNSVLNSESYLSTPYPYEGQRMVVIFNFVLTESYVRSLPMTHSNNLLNSY